MEFFSRFVRVQPIWIRNTQTTRAAFICICSEQVNNIIFPKNNPDRSREGIFWKFWRFLWRYGNLYIPYFQRDESLLPWTGHDISESLIYKNLEEKRSDCYPPEIQNVMRILTTRFSWFTGSPIERVQKGDFMTILHKESMKTNRPPSLEIGKIVRTAKVSNAFSKRFKPQFTDMILIVIDIKTIKPGDLYELEDLKGEQLLASLIPKNFPNKVLLFYSIV